MTSEERITKLRDALALHAEQAVELKKGLHIAYLENRAVKVQAVVNARKNAWKVEAMLKRREGLRFMRIGT